MVQSVVIDEFGNAVWTFNCNINVIDQPVNGLRINGNDAPFVQDAGANWVSLGYSSVVSPGDPWTVVPGAIINITFANGLPGPQSGVVS